MDIPRGFWYRLSGQTAVRMSTSWCSPVTGSDAGTHKNDAREGHCDGGNSKKKKDCGAEDLLDGGGGAETAAKEQKRVVVGTLLICGTGEKENRIWATKGLLLYLSTENFRTVFVWDKRLTR